MAVLTEVPGLKVIVSMADDRSQLEEYTDEDGEPAVIERAKKTVYIESQVGRPFGVVFAFNDIFPYAADTVACFLFVDGKLVDSYTWAGHPYRTRKPWVIDNKKVYEQGAWHKRPLVFTTLPISETI